MTAALSSASSPSTTFTSGQQKTKGYKNFSAMGSFLFIFLNEYM
jgi:hypothetical protein